jgi:hypothetical protein
MRIHAVIATTGRPLIVKQVVSRLSSQSRPPDGMLVVGASPDDIAGLDGAFDNLETMVARRGLCRQRNAALDHLGDSTDVVAFFDDDFVPAHDFLAQLEALLEDQPNVVGATGILVADGAQTQPIGFDDAIVRLDRLRDRPTPNKSDCLSLYGCNMAIRLSAAVGLRFDEKLPLYGWQEDVDFTPVELAWAVGQDQRTDRDSHGCAQRENVWQAARLFADRQCRLSLAQGYDVSLAGRTASLSEHRLQYSSQHLA